MKRNEVIAINLSTDGVKAFNQIVNKVLLADPAQGAYIFRTSIKSNEENKIDIEEADKLKFSVLCSLLSDLLEQGWRIQGFDTTSQSLFIDVPSIEKTNEETTEDVKARIRAGLAVVSNKQLASPSVQDFLRRMEKERNFKGKFRSIFNLVDDGKELFKEIKSIIKNGDNLEEGLNKLIKPYVQVCEDGIVCEKTGLPLLDVWRYFRHTWSLEYKPLPGRTMRLLIRNKAKKDWPIIGIAMLASPAMNLFVRDEWIGWRSEDLIDGLMDRKINAAEVATFLFNTMKEALGNIRKDDILTSKEISTPNELTILKLKQMATASKSNRRGELTIAEDRLKAGKAAETDDVIDIRSFKGDKKINWRKLSATSLYRKKRAETLVPLLKAYWNFKGANVEKEPTAALYALLSTRVGRESVSVALNELRKLRLASQVADVSVCGSVAPYNEILGGKLVTILMGSEEVREIYKQKYDQKVSEIASQLAGKPICRSTDLLVLTTTSLYGIGSSQYNRIKFSKKYVPGLAHDYEWKKLRLTEGFGVTHLSDETVVLVRKLCRHVYGAKRVNSVFGEGSSPKVRLIREALLILGINDQVIMKHGMQRMVYAHEYYPGARGDLSGFNPSGKTPKIPSVNTLSKAWVKRWVTDRVQRKDVLDKLKTMNSQIISQNLKTRINDYSKLHTSLDLDFEQDADILEVEVAAE